MATYDLANQNAPTEIKPYDIINCSYCGTMKTITLPPGEYLLECWGAQGGNAYTTAGGKGGYSYGILTLMDNTTLYLCAGGQGTSDNGSYTSTTLLAGGWNGGGAGRAWSGTSHNGAGGGGASDIRIGNTSVSSRVIVAGGGGGASDNGVGGVGGGTSGGSGSVSGGMATSGSAFGYSVDCTYTGGECGGGGGGWYGGYSASSENASGGGGSGYVYTISTYNYYPASCTLNSDYYLTNAATIAGNSNFTNPDGNINTGQSGNGYVRITVNSIITRLSIYLKTGSTTWKQIN